MFSPAVLRNASNWIAYVSLRCRFCQDIEKAEEQEAKSVSDFKSSVAALRSKVTAAAADRARKANPKTGSRTGAASSASSGSRGPVSLAVPASGLTPPVLQRLAPAGCNVASSARHKAWRAWWVSPMGHLGNRSRSWGAHGHEEAGLALLRCVWDMYTQDTGEPCPHTGLWP